MEEKITKATLKRTFKKFYCPECGKALINISDKDELLDGVSKFWCDDCKLDFTIEDTKDDYLYGEMKVRIEDDFEEDVLHLIPVNNADIADDFKGDVMNVIPANNPDIADDFKGDVMNVIPLTNGDVLKVIPVNNAGNQYDNVDLICEDDVLNAPNILTDKDHPYLYSDNCTLSPIYLDEMIENNGYSITIALDNEFPHHKSILNKTFKPMQFDSNDRYFVYYVINSKYDLRYFQYTEHQCSDISITGLVNCYVILHSGKTRKLYKYKSNINITNLKEFISEILIAEQDIPNDKYHIYANTNICIPGIIRSIICSKKSMLTYRKGAAKYDIPVGSCEIGPFNFLWLKSDPVRDCYAMVTVTEIKPNSNFMYPTYIIYDFHWRNVNHTISYCAANIIDNKYSIRKYYGDSNLSEFIGLKHSKHFNVYSEYIPDIIKEDYKISKRTLDDRDKNN